MPITSTVSAVSMSATRAEIAGSASLISSSRCGPPAEPRVDVARAERLAEDPLHQVALLVGGVADDRRRPGPAERRPLRRPLDRLRPARRAELTKAKDAKPDAIFAFYPGAAGAQFLLQYQQAGLRVKFRCTLRSQLTS